MRLRAAHLVLLALPIVMAPSLPAWSGSRDNSVAGRFVRIEGKTREASSFARRRARADFMDVSFGEDRFAALAVSGEYNQKGKKLRFRVDPDRLRDYEMSWEQAFTADLQEDGLQPDEVTCEVTKAQLRARSRHREVKFKSKYRFHCVATGDFGQRGAKGQIRFRGKGKLDVVPPRDPSGRPPGTGGVILQTFDPRPILRGPADSQGSAGAHLSLTRGSAGLVETSVGRLELSEEQREVLLEASEP